MHRLQRRSSRKCLTSRDLQCVIAMPYVSVWVPVPTQVCVSVSLPRRDFASVLAVGSLDTLVWQAIGEKLLPEGCKYIVPMIDARRMEVYTAVFTPDGKQVSETEPKIIDNESFADILAEGPVLFIGDGAGKCAEMINSDYASFVQTCPKAESMLVPGCKLLADKQFEDVAYFEPFYLKQFVPTVSKKKVF